MSERASNEWIFKVYLRTRGLWENVGGGKLERDLNDVTQLEEGHRPIFRATLHGQHNDCMFCCEGSS